ncbi:MAG: hypothetical protein WC612_01150 [Bdellovibrionales bacterium]|jgi:flagellin-like hook-associated protein FlgL
MSIGDISLSASARQNLLALQGTSKLLGQTQARLASGKKINSALDNASSFFSSKGFLNSANDLTSLKDSMSTALQTIKAASDTIESLSTVVDQLKGIVNSALQSTDSTTRATLATQYNDLLDQFNLLVADGTFNGTNLVNSINSSLKVSFSTTDTTDNLTVQGRNLTASGLGMGDALANFSSTTLVDTVTHALTVSSVDQTLTSQVYTGTLSALTVTGAGSSGVGSGVGATQASNSTDYITGAIAGVFTVATTGATVASAAASGTLTALEAVLGLSDGTGSDITGVSRSLTADTTGLAGLTAGQIAISGQFTVTGGAGSTYTSATGVLTGGAANTVTLGAGQSMQVIVATAATTANSMIYTNNTANAITFNLVAADTSTALSKANVTSTFKLTAGTVTTTGLSIPTSAAYTLGGNSIVDSQDGAVGATLSYIDSALSSLTAAGTTTVTGGTAYDVTGATITGVANTDVTATVVGTASATYAATDAHITLTGASILSDNKTLVTADALTSAQNQLTDALKTLRTASSALGNNNTIVSTRQDFTKNLITTLQTASDNLVLADTNEEGANLQSLQASSSLGVIALGISGQQAQAILRLF